MRKSIAEVLDGYSIALLKQKNIGTPETESSVKWYEEGFKELEINYPHIQWGVVLKTFLDINSSIWLLEADVRKGALDQNIEEVGRRAILIREFNRIRVGLGNSVLAMMGEAVGMNIKKDHASG